MRMSASVSSGEGYLNLDGDEFRSAFAVAAQPAEPVTEKAARTARTEQ